MKKIIVSPLCTASICLSVTLLAAGLAAQIAAALVPNIILPALDIPTLAALSLLALVLEVILFGENHRFWATSLIVGTVAFGVLSLCAGSVPTVLDALRVGILGGAVFHPGPDLLRCRGQVPQEHGCGVRAAAVACCTDSDEYWDLKLRSGFPYGRAASCVDRFAGTVQLFCKPGLSVPVPVVCGAPEGRSRLENPPSLKNKGLRQDAGGLFHIPENCREL